MNKKTLFLVSILLPFLSILLQAQTFEGDKPDISYNSEYYQVFHPDSGWNNMEFYRQWDALVPHCFKAEDIASGHLQFEWISKRVLGSKKSYNPPYIFENETNYFGNTNRGGVVIRVKTLSESVQEPNSGIGFNRDGIAFYPTLDGSSMIVQFSGVDMGSAGTTKIVPILVPKPASVADLKAKGKLRIEDFGETIYVYYNELPFIHIDLSGKTEDIYTSATVYDSDMQVWGSASGVEIELSGIVSVAQRDAILGLYSSHIYYNEKIEPIDSAEYKDLYADTWVATDALGRNLPSFDEVGPLKEDKDRTVGIFYITWHTENHYSNFNIPYSANVSEILQEDPVARLNAYHPLWKDGSYHWGEPETGYFLSQDEYVIRKDMNMLALAGVDVIILDVTNAVRYWNEWEVLFNTMERMKAEGNKVPQFCFWAFNGPVITVVQELYEWFYKTPRFKDLWFTWEDKPLMLYNGNPDIVSDDQVYINPNPNYDPAAITDTDNPHYGDPDYTNEYYKDYTQEVKDFFNTRSMWWGYYQWEGERYVGTEDNWSFGYDLSHGLVKAMDPDDLVSTHNGRKEEAAVTPAQHASSMVGKSWRRNTGEPPLNIYDKVDVAYVPWLGKTVSNPEAYGIYFQDRWDEALASDPDFLYINDWNEWTAGKYNTDPGTTTSFMGRNNPFFFVDQYNAEFNRCVQPMKDGYTDNYFMQMAQNIRRYKGVRQKTIPQGFDPIEIDGDFSDWENVVNEYRDPRGDTYHRDHNGYGGLHYTNNTGRNDIISSKVSFNDDYLSFYVSTAHDLTTYSDPNWMLLFLDVDRNKGTGWEGYDFIVNNAVLSANETSLKQWDGESWVNEVSIPYAVNGNELEFSIPRNIVMLEDGTPEFYFHWADNPQQLKDISCFFTDGESAPERRFNYDFSSSKIETKEQSGYKELNIPGTIEFEDFDLGGAGIAYSDADIANNGGEYRMNESVDISKKADDEFFLSGLHQGEWLEYQVNVNAIGKFNASIHYAAEIDDNKLLVSFDDLAKTDTIVLPATGASQSWASYDVELRLSEGENIMKFSITNSSQSFYLDKVVFTALDVAYPGNGDGLEKTIWTGEVGGRNWFVDSICSEIDPFIDEKWEDVGPGCDVAADFWNIRWQGRLEPLYTEEYTFYLSVNDLGRLWVNEELIIDGWTSAATGNTLSGKIDLVAGKKVNIRVDFAEKTGGASVKLEWESEGNPREVIPKNQLYSSGYSAIKENISNQNICIFPNPAKEQITIQSYKQNISAISVFDIYGRIVLFSNEVLTNSKTFDLSGLKNGLYMVEIICGENTILKRFIKQ